MGGQDDFNQALDFVTGLGVTTPTMVWDPSFKTWTQYGIRANSSMILLNGGLTDGTEPFVGFTSAQQQRIIDMLDRFS
ncbi:MAG: hypothetical protein OXB92_03775 [Acidimicrobiaceae bacterium]|nr:hypothetical protein [Acidimicrobiia bacterium]MCY4492962.1 hypothetical protein [Acidimicrobiaceae bacterium]